MNSFWRIGVSLLFDGNGRMELGKIAEESVKVGLAMKALQATSKETGLVFGKVFGKALASFQMGMVGKDLSSFFFNAAKAAGVYQEQMTKIQISTGGTAEEMIRLGDVITDLTAGKNRTIFDAKQIGGIQQSLAQFGFTPPQNESLTRTVTYGAEIASIYNHESPEHYAANMGKYLHAWNLNQPGKEKEANSAVDTYSRIQRITGLSSNDLSVVDSYASKAAQSLGMGPNDLMQLMGVLRRDSLQPQQIGTTLRSLLTRLQPLTSVHAHGSQAQVQGLIGLGLVKPPDKGDYRFAYQAYKAEQAKMGMPVNEAGMTKKQQDSFGLKFYMAHLQTKFSNKLTAEELVTKLQMSAKYELTKHLDTPQGRQNAYAALKADLQSVFKTTAFQGALALATSGTPALKELEAQERKQKSAESAAYTLRYLLPNMLSSAPASMNTMLRLAGGSDGGSGVIPGGPLDLLTKFMHSLTDGLSNIIKFEVEHKKMMAMIGTMAGVTGLGLLAITLLAAVRAVRAVMSAFRELSFVMSQTAANMRREAAETKLINGGGVVPSFHGPINESPGFHGPRNLPAIAAANAKAEAAAAEKVAASAASSAAAKAASRGVAGSVGAVFASQAAILGISKLGAKLAPLGAMFARLGGGMGGAALSLGRLILGFIGIPGLIIAIIAGFVLFWQQPKLVGRAFGMIIVAFRTGLKFIIDAVVFVFTGIGHWIGMKVMQIMQLYKDFGTGNFGALKGDMENIYGGGGKDGFFGHIFGELGVKFKQAGVGADEYMNRSGHSARGAETRAQHAWDKKQHHALTPMLTLGLNKPNPTIPMSVAIKHDVVVKQDIKVTVNQPGDHKKITKELAKTFRDGMMPAGGGAFGTSNSNTSFWNPSNWGH